MKLSTAAVLVGVVLVAAAATDREPGAATERPAPAVEMPAPADLPVPAVEAPAPAPEDEPVPAPVDASHTAPQDVVVGAMCDEHGQAYDVVPDTPDARARAAEMCANTQRGLEAVGWADPPGRR